MKSFESQNGIFFARVKDKKDTSIPDYAKAKNKVKEAYLEVQAKIVAGNKAKEYLSQIKENLNKTNLPAFAKEVQSLGLTAEQTPEFNRGLYLPKIGISKEFQDEAFSLTEENRFK